jgi:hypothetical protein
MATIVCPNCNYRQEAGEKCRKCATIFAYHQGMDAPVQKATAYPAVRSDKQLLQELFRRSYRVVRWATLAFLVIVLILILHRARPPKVSIDAAAAARAESKLDAVASAPAAAQPSEPRELRLDEAELNSYLATHLDLQHKNAPPPAAPPGSPVPDVSLQEAQSSVRDLKVTMVDDRIRAYVVFDFHGEDLSLQLEGRLHVENGYLRFEPVSGELGSLPLPQSTLESAVDSMMASPENREKLRVPEEIRDIRIEHGELVVAYR